MRALARLVVVVGAVGVGALLFRAAPHSLELVYDVGRVPGATSVEVEIRRGGELVRRAELRVADRASQLHHPLRLPDGEYMIAYRVATPSGAVTGERALEVREGGTIVLPLGP